MTIFYWIVFIIIGFLIIHTNYVKVSMHSLSFNLSNKVTAIHISDLHGKTHFLNGSLSKIILEYKPDIVFITGDLTNRKNQLTSIINEVIKIKDSGTKIYFTPGNYERETLKMLRKRSIQSKEYMDNRESLEQYMTVLENKGDLINLNNVTLSVYGFDNSVYGNEKYTDNPLSSSDLTFYLAHSPNIITYLKNHNLKFNLLLTGHTHGGQVRLFNKTVGSYKQFHIGLRKLNNNQYFFITRGIGTVKIPVRINCYPEIAVFYLN
ncbi:Predicted phosphohydrolase, MPP superfamily [Gracilibacillus ureilyticus]|uniref:Predicted phosphohydrolase, MPP superfamily n=1 Tax=Gracilibacillus ureilyticus TaxID=531814 RepID=A0A1H9TWG3_9BACI|nr:metallophosphoesterase [Gracilibacillus ureilyticus]SES01449.1 Predicted phosphohydrolase, MPP superfamily [Gracilibacillus ureilyticus]